jgi:hypothetical protein
MNYFKEIELFGNHLKVFENGKVLVKRHYNDEYYEKKTTTCKIKGYIRICLSKDSKQRRYSIHRLVAYAFLNLDLENPKSQVDHQDRNTSNNNLSNLRIVTQQENQFNTKAKGYTWHKQSNKWQSQIKLNGKNIHLGRFEKEEDARQSYLVAKEKYHIIQ